MDIRKINAIEFLSSTEDYVIPFYQREYSWGKKEINQLLNDIWNNKNKSYYLGNIVLKKTHFEIIIVDGQQRITSMLLLVKQMSMMSGLSTREKDKIETILKSGYSRSLDLRANTMQKLIQGNVLSEEEKLTNYYVNYKEIENFFKDKEVSFVLNQLFKVDFAYIGLDDDVDEHVIFSQINSTGKPLTAFDLTKNYYFSKLEENLIDKLLDQLNSTTNGMSDSQKDNMLRHYVAYKTGKLVKKDTKEIYSAIRSVEGNEHDIIISLIEFSFIYKALLENDIELGVTVPAILHKSFNTFAVLLVDIIMNHSSIDNLEFVSTDIDRVTRCLNILECYKVRREFVSLKEKEITRFIPRLKILINQRSFGTYDEALVKALLVDANNSDKLLGYRMPTFTEFSEAVLTTPIYNETKFTKLLLERFEKYGTKEDTDLKKFTIEHIMPQTLSKEWEDYLGEDIKHYHKYLHTIGNLTLTADNSALSNKLFDEKKNILREKSRTRLNNQLQKYDKWNTSEITDRSKEFIDVSKKIWNIE